jgi:hypothetical protein
LQEDILTSRTLHYTKEKLVWECQVQKYMEGDASEEGIWSTDGESPLKRFFAPE